MNDLGPRALHDAGRELTRLPRLLDTILRGLDAVTARTRPARAEWAPIGIPCHLRDEEVEDFGARLRAVLECRREFAPIDPERWVEERHYRESNLHEVLAEFRDRRAASLEFLVSVD